MPEKRRSHGAIVRFCDNSSCHLLIFLKINSLDTDQGDIMSGLIWVQTVCENYQIDDTSKWRVNLDSLVLRFNPGRTVPA